MVDYTTKREIKKIVHVKNTKAIRALAVELFPELSGEFAKSKRNKQPYYKKLFEAAVTAHIWAKRFQKPDE